MANEPWRPDPRSWGDGYESGYKAGLEAAAHAMLRHDKEGRDWLKGSLWDTLARECAARIMALAPKDKS